MINFRLNSGDILSHKPGTKLTGFKNEHLFVNTFVWGVVQALFAAGEQKYGTDEGQFITILGNRSAAHLRRGQLNTHILKGQ